MPNGSAVQPTPQAFAPYNFGPLAQLGSVTPQQATLGQLGQQLGGFGGDDNIRQRLAGMPWYQQFQDQQQQMRQRFQNMPWYQRLQQMQQQRQQNQQNPQVPPQFQQLGNVSSFNMPQPMGDGMPAGSYQQPSFANPYQQPAPPAAQVTGQQPQGGAPNQFPFGLANRFTW